MERALPHPRRADVPTDASGFARWVQPRIGPGDTVADLGCGLGRDAAFFAEQGHPVLAYDVSPDARTATAKRLRRAGTRSVVRRLMLGELRTVAVSGAEIATAAEHRHVYARGLVGCVDEESRRNLWRLARTALAGSSGSLFLELAASSPAVPVHTPAEPRGLLRRLDADVVVREIEAYGGRVVAREEAPGEDLFDHPDPWTCRLQVTFGPTVPGGTPHV